MAEHFIFAELWDDRGPFVAKNKSLLKERFKYDGLPLYVILGPDGQERERKAGKLTLEPFMDFLRHGLQGS